MSRDAKWIWNAETPATVPAGARISAGKSGSVARSLPKTAVASVKRLPASCIPSPESPAMRTTTRSRVSVAFTCVFMPVSADGFNGLGVEEAPHHVGCPIVRRMNGDGVELAVHDEGEGPAVLLLHGFPDSARAVAPPDPGAQRRPGFRTVAPDLRGFGESDKPAGRRAPTASATASPTWSRCSTRSSIEQGARRRPRLGRRRGVGDGADGARARRAARRRSPSAIPARSRAAARPAREVLVHAAVPVPGGRGAPAQGRLGADARVDGDPPGPRRGDRDARRTGRADRGAELVPREHAPAQRAARRAQLPPVHGRHARDLEQRRRATCSRTG